MITGILITYSRSPTVTRLTAGDWVQSQDGYSNKSDVALNPHATDAPYLFIRPMDDGSIKGRISKEGIIMTIIIIIITGSHNTIPQLNRRLYDQEGRTGGSRAQLQISPAEDR